ncbi:hypothetical protein EV44_g3033 [Erysiphe necator]|uniref:Uncharacterized protein n=1 Tax=Uncinula necator TaxID=52586 RepID=A0A0B1P0W9_UNCNE|nr:hypothetical protein EV44_g3033 [Erysiphe necator]
MSSVAQIIKFMKGAPKLEESSYDRWSTQFLDVLSIFDLTDYVLETKAELSNCQKKNILDMDRTTQKQDECIRIAICQLVPDNVYHLFNSNSTAKEWWDNLKQYYCPNPMNKLDLLLEEFWQLESNDTTSVDALVQQLSHIRNESIITDDSFCGYALRT